MKASLSGKLASMGSAVPYAIAAKMAFPDRAVIAIAGDGAMQMNGLAELITVKQYWSRWSNPSFVVMVLVNGDLNEVTWEQRALAGDPKFDAAQNVEPFAYAKYAELLGFEGIRIDRPDDIVAGWQRALSAAKPVLIEFHTDPNVPPRRRISRCKKPSATCTRCRRKSTPATLSETRHGRYSRGSSNKRHQRCRRKMIHDRKEMCHGEKAI